MQAPTRDSEGAHLPSRIGPFLIASELARGQLATVYVGYPEGAPDASPRAIKRVRSALRSVSGWGALIADEAQLLARIDHPHVIGVEGVGEDDGVYVALEYVEGENLERLLRLPDVPRSPALICAIIADALRGLSAAHAARAADGAPLALAHQAPRPRHILVGRDGRARLVDFTQARASSLAPNNLRRQRLRAGSMAPEHTLAPQHVDQRADLFILGMTLWEALTERPLFETKLASQAVGAVAGSRYPKPSAIGAKPPACLDALCARALERDPDRRFQSADEMLEALLGAAREIGGLAPAPEVARAVDAALSGRPPARRPSFPPEASGAYETPAALRDQREDRAKPSALARPSADRDELTHGEVNPHDAAPSGERPLASTDASAHDAASGERRLAHGAETQEDATSTARPPAHSDASAHDATPRERGLGRGETKTHHAGPPSERLARGDEFARLAARREAAARSLAPHGTRFVAADEALAAAVFDRPLAREPAADVAPARHTERRREAGGKLARTLFSIVFVSAMLMAGEGLISALLPMPEAPRLDGNMRAQLPEPAAATSEPVRPAQGAAQGAAEVAPAPAASASALPPGEARGTEQTRVDPPPARPAPVGRAAVGAQGGAARAKAMSPSAPDRLPAPRAPAADMPIPDNPY